MPDAPLPDAKPPAAQSPAASGKISIRCRVNGRDETLHDYPMARLLDTLREKLRLTGIKEGCGEGECGACSVELNGKLVNSCLVPIAQVEGTEIRTIEGVATQGQLNAVQQAFISYGGAQCGICTPGMVLAAVNLLEQNNHPTEPEIRAALAGNLCRCTGYMKIFEAILRACDRTEVHS
ncbi:MAG: (2Fe-2S)-binding protein [Candidatus Acidiferrales bacterium]